MWHGMVAVVVVPALAVVADLAIVVVAVVLQW